MSLGEREDRLGVDRHLRLGALEAVPFDQLVVVDDDPVVHADDGAVADRMVVGLDPGVALRVVAHVDQGLARAGREDDLLEQSAGAGALLVDRRLARAAPVGVPDGVGAALGDPGEQGLGRERPVDPLDALKLYPAIPHISLLEDPLHETGDPKHGRHRV